MLVLGNSGSGALEIATTNPVELHSSHPGMVRLARAHVWWPGLSAAMNRLCTTVMHVGETVSNHPQFCCTPGHGPPLHGKGYTLTKPIHF